MPSKLEQYAKQKYPNAQTPKQPEVVWHSATVIQVQPHLGQGFIRGGQCYFIPSHNDGEWVVYNGSLAIRHLTTEQMQASLKAHRTPDGKVKTCHNSQEIQRRYWHELTR